MVCELNFIKFLVNIPSWVWVILLLLIVIGIGFSFFFFPLQTLQVGSLISKGVFKLGKSIVKGVYKSSVCISQKISRKIRDSNNRRKMKKLNNSSNEIENFDNSNVW